MIWGGSGHLAQVLRPTYKVGARFVSPRGRLPDEAHIPNEAHIPWPWSLVLPASEKGVAVDADPDVCGEYGSPSGTKAEEGEHSKLDNYPCKR